MNADKAREYFSAYHEGTLELGLAETFERALRTDAQVQAEYRAYERTVESLQTLASPVPEPDFDLHELISRRLDKHVYDEKRRTVSPIFGWWKSLALGGLATVALVAAVLQLRSTGDVNVAGPTPVLSNRTTDRVELLSDAQGYRLEYRAKDSAEITVRASDGDVLAQKKVNAETFKSPLSNPNATAALLEVDVAGDKELIFVALPGTRMESATSGSGSIKDLALALAGFYRTPILIRVGEDSSVKWEFGPGEPHDAAETALKGTPYTAIKNPDGVVSIQPN